MNRTNPPDSAAERRSSVSVFVASTYGDSDLAGVARYRVRTVRRTPAEFCRHHADLYIGRLRRLAGDRTCRQ